VQPPTIRLAGAALLADPSGALYWPDEETLIVADLHLEKGSSHARRGIFLPPYDSRATLTRLAALCAQYRPVRVIALGDSFHDPEGPARLPAEESSLLRRLTAMHAFTWIAGNHDGLGGNVFGGSAEDELKLGPLTFRHIPRAHLHEGEIAGHLHPCATVATRAKVLRRPCFAADGARCVLPAFGAFTGGLDIMDPAFDGLFGEMLTAFLLGARAVHAFPILRAYPRRKMAAAPRPQASASEIAPRP
jgi:DNA ligase-associated metallophosphoesterase